MSRSPRSSLAELLFVAAVAATILPSIAGAQPLRPSPASADVPGLAASVEAVRRASVAWERRPGPERQVVDQVCLVPDLPTFLEAIASWDGSHYFPVLIDDVDLSMKFLRAFRPARIVRSPRKVEPAAADKLWDAAVGAVGRSWKGNSAPSHKNQRGDEAPRGLGPTPPGVVFSAPESPLLGGAAALAAGRFQPLLRWDTSKRYADVLSETEATDLATELEEKIAGVVPRHDQLGDDCDFVTLAGDWPYRYNTKDGANAFDDLIGRFPTRQARWAFAGRLSGDLKSGVYQAMCSLFLQPRSAVLINKYSEKDRPWSDYTMSGASLRLAQLMPVKHQSGPQSNLTGWHSVFDPKNRYGLVLINSHGEPTRFHLTDGVAHTADVPATVPTIVLMIHSYSAADFANPETIAGRWLENGAYLYYGAMNEPYLNAFRPPLAVAELVAEGIPLAAALRQSPPELFGRPWRLLYLGDPLYRCLTERKSSPRADHWETTAQWPVYEEFREPDAGSSEDARLNWVLKSVIFRLRAGVAPSVKTDPLKVLTTLRRERISAKFQPIHDGLLIDQLIEANPPRSAELLERLKQVPTAARSPSVRRLIETLQVARLQPLLASGDFAQALNYWDEVVRSPMSADLQQVVGERVGALANSRARLEEWRNRLLAARSDLGKSPSLPLVENELKHVVEKLKASKPR